MQPVETSLHLRPNLIGHGKKVEIIVSQVTILHRSFEPDMPSYLKQGISLSLFFHLILALLIFLGVRLGWPVFTLFSPSENIKPTPIEIIDVKDLPKEERERLRTVGVADGKKEDFTLPVFEKKPQKSPEIKQSTTPSLKDLRTKRSATEQQMAQAKPEKNLAIEKMSEAELVRLQADSNLGPPERLSQNTIGEFATSPMDEYVLNKSSFNFKMSPPRGVPLDQLNSAEKMFYTFNKRTFETYINAFLTSYHQMSTNHPQIDPKLSQDIHRLVGKLTFDGQGNIISIKMIKWDNDDLVQKLFEDTLVNIHAIPNPPKALLDDRGEFYIYFQLNIND